MTKEHNCIYHYFSILYTKQFVIFKERKTEEKEKEKKEKKKKRERSAAFTVGMGQTLYQTNIHPYSHSRSAQ